MQEKCFDIKHKLYTKPQQKIINNIKEYIKHSPKSASILLHKKDYKELERLAGKAAFICYGGILLRH